MAHLSDAQIRARLFETIRDERFGMLGQVDATGGLPQPMTTYLDEGDETLWFYSHDDTDLARGIGAGGGDGDGLYVFSDKKHELFASVTGRMTLTRDQERIRRFWNPVVAAWYPSGRDDPKLTLIRLDATRAEVWLSSEGPVKFGLEIAKANLGKHPPDIGQKADLQL